MHDTTTLEFFKLLKGCVERKLDRNGWQWSMQDSLLLDWAIQNMEATHAN